MQALQALSWRWWSGPPACSPPLAGVMEWPLHHEFLDFTVVCRWSCQPKPETRMVKKMASALAKARTALVASFRVSLPSPLNQEWKETSNLQQIQTPVSLHESPTSNLNPFFQTVVLQISVGLHARCVKHPPCLKASARRDL